MTGAVPASRAPVTRGVGAFRHRRRPGPTFGYITPNWFAAVMGTGIVAVAASGLPWSPPGLRQGAFFVWVLAAVMLVVVTAATLTHWRRYPEVARTHADDPVVGYFYGAVPMALLTVGAGTLLLGRDVLGDTTAVDVDWVLWTAGTIGGLATALMVPARIRRRPGGHAAFGGRLMPVVAPMVSASTGGLLVGHTDGGAAVVMLVSCYILFAGSLALSAGVIARLGLDLVRTGVGPARLTPTLFIVVGPLGQSGTAVHLLGSAAHGVVPDALARVLVAFATVYTVLALSGAGIWALLAAVLVANARPAFSLAWWSFTFPVGTCVTAANGLAAQTDWTAVVAVAVALGAALVVLWLVVFARTVAGCVSGHLLLIPTAQVAAATHP